MKTLLITLNYNQPKLIENLANSLIKWLPVNGWHWFIRDNSANDESAKAIQAIGDARITLSSYENKGNYASMHNELMREGLMDGYDLICLLNNDMVAMTDFLTPMRAKFRDDSVGAVGAQLFYPNGQLQHAGIIIHENGQPLNVSSAVMQKLSLWPTLPRSDREYQAITGACLMMKASDYKFLEGMDERFEWCFDDVDLCLRIGQTLKKKCVYAEAAKLIHYENYSTLKNPTELKPKFPAAFELLKQKFIGQLRPDIQFYQMDYGKYR
jgi:GT2 family glycosyltransferase